MLCHNLFLKNQSRLKTFPFLFFQTVFKNIEYRKKVTTSNHKTSPVILIPESPQSPDFTIKKEPNIFDSQERETGIEPATLSLARRCSTAEPLAHIYVLPSLCSRRQNIIYSIIFYLSTVSLYFILYTLASESLILASLMVPSFTAAKTPS